MMRNFKIFQWCIVLLWIRNTISYRGMFFKSPKECSPFLRNVQKLSTSRVYEGTSTAVTNNNMNSNVNSSSTTSYSFSSPVTDIDPDRLSIFKTNNEYDGEKIDNYYNNKPIIVWERFVDIGSPLLGWWLIKKFNNITAPFRTLEENIERKNLLAADLKNSIVQTKSVTIIKSGQALALRPDLIKSPEYIRELTKLQDEVGTFDNEIAMQIIREELGQEPSEVYRFDPILPIASASIGQVYKATLITTNQTVAVKVQRPDAIEHAALDMFILRKGAAFLKKRFKIRSDLVGIVDVFGSQLFKELNYVQEANNCMKFRDMYGSIPNIYVPLAYLNLTRTRVLTLEFVEGIKGPWSVGGERMLTLGLQCSVLQLLGSGYFHSDPHRGNLLQSPTGDLVYLDFGMMSEVPATQRFALIGTVIGLVNKDITLVIQNLKKLDFFPPETDEQLVVNALTQAVMNATDNGEGSSLNFTKLSKNIDSISTILPFRLPPFYSFIIRTLTILEGLALYVDPSFRLIRGAYPFVAKQMLSAPSEEMTSLLKSVLINTKDGSIKWEKLEQFISIASNADAAMGGDFQALKKAQERSDIARVYSGKKIESNMTFDVTLQIFDFLISENGKFLLDPLITEIVETIEALGLSAVALSSIITSGLIPPPEEKPNKEKVKLFFKLMSTVLSRVDIPSSPNNNNNNGNENSGKSESGVVRNKEIAPYTFDTASKQEGGVNINADVSNSLQASTQRLNVLRTGFSFISGLFSLPPDRITQLQPIITRSSVLIRAVVAKLVERGARRVVRRVVSPNSVSASLPVVGRVVDFILPLLLPKKVKQNQD